MTRANPGARYLPLAPGLRPIRHLDLFSMLVWCFRDQYRGGSGDLWEDDGEPHGVSGCGCAAVERIAQIGTEIDVSRYKPEPEVHPDARALVSAMRKAGVFAPTLITPAQLGEPPEIIKGPPKAWPQEADRSREVRWAEAWVNGRKMDIRVINTEGWYWKVTKVVMRSTRRSKGDWSKTRPLTTRVRVPIDAWAIRWDPNGEEIKKSLAKYRAWREEIERLWQHILAEEVEFQSHVVTGIRQPWR